MYIDQAQTKPYEEYLQRAAKEYQDAQYDAAQVRQWIGWISARLGERMMAWGQRLQAKAPTATLNAGR